MAITLHSARDVNKVDERGGDPSQGLHGFGFTDGHLALWKK
jgi:hypothetical protein